MHSPAATPTSNLLFRYQSPSSRSPSASPRRAVFTDSEYVAKRIAVAAKDVEIRTLKAELVRAPRRASVCIWRVLGVKGRRVKKD
jgi:hypothetical protein